ncbi:MAG: hypothetical protein WAN50_00815 [Minisyncoccia bacterium]
MIQITNKKALVIGLSVSIVLIFALVGAMAYEIYFPMPLSQTPQTIHEQLVPPQVHSLTGTVQGISGGKITLLETSNGTGSAVPLQSSVTLLVSSSTLIRVDVAKGSVTLQKERATAKPSDPPILPFSITETTLSAIKVGDTIHAYAPADAANLNTFPVTAVDIAR